MGILHLQRMATMRKRFNDLTEQERRQQVNGAKLCLAQEEARTLLRSVENQKERTDDMVESARQSIEHERQRLLDEVNRRFDTLQYVVGNVGNRAREQLLHIKTDVKAGQAKLDAMEQKHQDSPDGTVPEDLVRLAEDRRQLARRLAERKRDVKIRFTPALLLRTPLSFNDGALEVKGVSPPCSSVFGSRNAPSPYGAVMCAILLWAAPSQGDVRTYKQILLMFQRWFPSNALAMCLPSVPIIIITSRINMKKGYMRQNIMAKRRNFRDYN